MSSSKSSQLLREEKEGKSSWRSLTVCLHPIFLCHEAGSGCDKGKERVPKAHIKCDCPLASKVPTLELREGCRKKTRIFYGLLLNQGGGRGVSEGSVKTILLFWKSIFSESIKNHSRTPKTCFALGLESIRHIQGDPKKCNIRILGWNLF